MPIDDPEWPVLSEFLMEERDVTTDESRTIAPSSHQYVFFRHGGRLKSENAAKLAYETECGFHVENTEHKRGNGLKYALEDLPDEALVHLEEFFNDCSSVDESASRDWIDALSGDGVPDLVMFQSGASPAVQFVEVKQGNESLQDSQRKWMATYEELPIKVARVTHRDDQPDVEKRRERGPSNPPSIFERRRWAYRRRPTSGTRAENGGMASLATLLHYGLLEATGYETGVIRSMNRKVVAASIAALRGQGESAVEPYRQQPKATLLDKLEMAFLDELDSDETRIRAEDSVGGTGGDICAALEVLDRADPLAASKKHLEGDVR